MVRSAKATIGLKSTFESFSNGSLVMSFLGGGHNDFVHLGYQFTLFYIISLPTGKLYRLYYFWVYACDTRYYFWYKLSSYKQTLSPICNVAYCDFHTLVPPSTISKVHHLLKLIPLPSTSQSWMFSSPILPRLSLHYLHLNPSLHYQSLNLFHLLLIHLPLSLPVLSLRSCLLFLLTPTLLTSSVFPPPTTKVPPTDPLLIPLSNYSFYINGQPRRNYLKTLNQL